ncbi:MAG: succinate--CoA ligase subunit alpha, partial [Desulfobacteraceae bacterium]
MSILVDEKTRVVVQGITGREGTFHTKQMLAYGTVVAAGVTPGKGDQQVEGIPVFNTIHEAI